MGGKLSAVPDRHRPPVVRDCPECGLAEGMALKNVARTRPINIPLLYVCTQCGCTLTIPPAQSPIGGGKRRDV